ncbi:MAG: alpha/beta fold hydrolase [Pseudomonadota bacterium]
MPTDARPALRRFASPDGVTLVGEVGGPEEAPTVVLMHGGGQTRHSWSGAMRALLDRGYRVVNYDARGHGDSDWSPTGAYDLDDRAHDLAAVVGKMPSRFALVGASLGGATAIQAVALGLRPAAVVLVDIVPEPEAEGIHRIVSFMSGHLDGFATLDDAIDAVAAYNPERARPSDPTGLMRNLRAMPDGRLRWHWDPQIISDAPEVHHRKVRAAAKTLSGIDRLPVLLVRGMQSDVVSDDGIARFRQMLPRLEVVDVAGAGHMVAGDRNDAFNAGVIDFLARHMPVEARHDG